MLVVRMVGRRRPRRSFSRLYRVLMTKLELNSVPRSSKISRSAPETVSSRASFSPAGSEPKCSVSTRLKKSGLEM